MKYDLSHIDRTKMLPQASTAIAVLLRTPAFIREHQLWKGFFKHRWITIVTLVILGFLSFTLYDDIQHYFSPDKTSEEIVIDMDNLDDGIKQLEEGTLLLPEAGKAGMEEGKKALVDAKETLENHHRPLFAGSYKFLILIFLEILIFHFSVRTNNILKNENRELAVKEFSRAQIRMIKVMAHKWIFGLIIYILLSILFGILGVSVITDFVMFFVYSFFLGFAFLDNYLEQYHFSIKQSSVKIQSHLGAATAFGVMASAGMSIPLIGPVIMPFVFAVAATLYGHEVRIEQDLSGH